MQLLGIAGSLRQGSYNRALLRTLQGLLPEGSILEIAEVGELPLYNADHEGADYPAAASALKEKILAADGVIIATPEYNRGVPGVLKNAIDWASRPYGKSAWPAKHVWVVGASSGNIGAAVAQNDLKRTMLYLSCRVLGQPEVYLNGKEKFGEEGVLADETTREFLRKGLETFITFIRS